MSLTRRDFVRVVPAFGAFVITTRNARAQEADPAGDLDAMWAKGMMPPGDFVAIVYNTLS